MEKTWKITLADGTVIDGLGLNGNNFVSETEVKEGDFSGRLASVTIEDTATGEAEEHQGMELVQVAHYPDADPPGWYIALRDYSPAELAVMKMQANIEYIAMMTGTDLEG